ncbi:MAG: hypothetical protein AAB414_05595 [Patescibacteria group bacterium]
MNKKQNLHHLRVSVIILILGLMGVLIYISQIPRVKVQQAQKQPEAVKSEINQDDVIDCAKKDQADQLAVLLNQKQSDNSCLFIGCSGFF